MGRALQGTTVAEKLALNSRREGECLRWTGAHTPTGYGQLAVDGRRRSVHRLAYELAHGPIPDGCEIDHVTARGCRFRDCIEPTHLEAVSHAENVARMIEHRYAVCPQGHPRSGHNLRTNGRGERFCRRCFNDRRNQKRAELRAKKALEARDA